MIIMDLRLAVIGVILIGIVSSGPVKNLNSNTKCAVQCTNKNKFSYRVGTIYEYSYEAETKTGIQGSTEEQGGLKVTATAEIEVISKCELILSIKNSNILGSDPDYPGQFKQHPQRREFQKQLEDQSLRFSFQDGIVEEICPDDSESVWSTNFKRGVLTAFQNSMDSFDRETEVTETDVSGKCLTTYRVIQEGWKTIKVKKSKDLVSCTNRHGFQTSAQATIYNVPSSVQSLPLLKSTQECDQVLNTQGRVESTFCHEIHLFRPFAKDNNGAITEVIQKLTFVTEKRGGQPISGSINRRESLLYTHHISETKTSNNKDAALKKLTELCTTTKDGITPETPKLFSELVYILKELNSDDLTDVYEQSQMDSFCIDNSDRVKKFYSDAVPMIGTTAAVKQIAKLILRNEITGRMAEIWLSSLSLVQNPSKEMLGEISKLMDLPEGTRVYLPASVMVNTYCKENENCENLSEVDDIVSKLQKAVGSSCIVTEGNYMEVLTSLRAIGNIEFAEKLVPTIDECISKKTNDMEIRVAAVEAYRRMSCGADRNNLMILYRDDTEDSELRISAYIQVMKCPTDNIISQVKDTLAGEEVNQVGSFVWTHLTNLMETSLVHKQNIQSILEDETLKKEFDLDKRKFSRNYEWSYFSESLNAGAGVESNLVWSQKSFVPRSAMVNLTVDLFGHSVNLFEFGGRVEGLEKVLAENFGPKGYFGAKQDLTPEQKLNQAVDFNKIEQIDEKLGKKDDEMKGSAFMRMFGNEISYYNTKQSSDNKIPNGNPFNFLDTFMNLAKEQEFSQKMSKLLLDSSIITPTVTGLPLNLKAVAASTIDLNAKGKMDLRSPSKKIILEGSLMPSGAVEVTSTMSIDAFVTKSGLKMSSTFHTSTAVTAKFELDNNQELTMEFNIPKEKSELVNVKSQFFVVHADVEKEQKMITKNRITKNSCSGATLARLTGVEFCADMSLPGDVEKPDAPHFPLTGPSKFALSVLKKDTHTSYKFNFKGIMNKKKTVFWMMYDTPGSKVMRKTGFTVEINHQNKDMEINMISPWKTAKFEGNLVSSKKRKAVTGIVTVDSSKKYQAEASVLITETKTTKIYKPKIEIIRPSADPIVLGGEIVYKAGKVMTSKLVLTGAMEKPASLDMSVRFTKFEYGLTGTILHSKDQKYTVDVNLEVNSKPKRSIYKPRMIVSIPEKEYINMYGSLDLRSAKGKVVRYDLVVNKLFKTPIKVKGASSIQSKGKRTIHKGNVYLTAPQKITTRVRYVFDKKLRITTTDVKLDYNFQKIYKSLKDSIQFKSKFMKKSVKTSQRINFNSNLKSARFADYNNQVKLKIDHRPQSKIDADLTVDYGKTFMSKVNKHRMSVLTSTKYNIKPNSGVINYNVTFRLPAEKLDSYFSGTHKYSKKDLKSDLHIRYDNKKSADISISLVDSSKKYFRYSGDFALKYAGRHVQVIGQAVEKEREYSSKWSVQHQAGHTSVLIGAYSWPSNVKRDIVSSIRIDGQDPVTLTGSAVINSKKPEGTIKVKVGKDFYVISGVGNYNGESFIQGQGKINYPGRQIMCDLSGGLKNDEYSGSFDLNWNVRDKKGVSRVVLEGSFRNNTIEDFSVSAHTIFPGRELSASIQHYSKDKIDTTVSFGWNKDKVISTSLKFNNDRRKYRHMLEGTISLNTPFKRLLEFEIGGNLEKTRTKHTQGLTFTWNKGKTVAFQYDTKTPIDISDLDMNIHMKTPYPRIGNPMINMQNKMSTDLIRQEGNFKVTWGNNQYVAIETNGNSLYEGPKRKLKRNVGVLTSFDDFKVTTLNFTHEDDLKKFLSEAVFVKDSIKYLYILNMDHSLDGWSMQNAGTFDISSPLDTLKFVWSHKNTEKNLETVVNADWGSGHKFYAKAGGNLETLPNRKYVAGIEMTIPSSKFSSLNINIEHEDKVGYVKTIGKIIANRENAGTVKLNYARQLGSTDFDFRITSKYIKDFIIDGRTRHAHMPMTGTLKMQWSEIERIFLDGSLRYDQLGTVDSKVELTTTFGKARRVILKATHKMDHLDWVAASELEFAPMQKINAAVRYNTGLDQLVRLQVTTPFPQFKKLNTGAYFKYILHPSQWESKMDFEIVPLVGKITSFLTWQNDTKSSVAFRLDTPFQKIPYMSAEVESEKDIAGRRTSKLMLEYLPTQKIELTSNYKLKNGKDFDGSISVKSPFNEEVYAMYQQKGYSKNDLRGFNRRVQLKYKRTQNIIIDTTFGTKPRLFGNMEIKMPVRGYETVKLSFTHKGKHMNDFHTTVDYETNGKKIELETLFDIIDDVRGKMKLTSPFSMRIAQIEYSHEGTPTNFKTHGGVIYNDFKTDADAVFTHSDLQTTGSFTFKSPIEGAKDIMVTFNKDGTWKKLSFNGEAGYESGSKYIVAVKHSLEDKDAATDVVIQNPLTEDIILKVSYDNRKKGFTTIVQGSVGTENSAALETTYKLKNYNLDLEVDLKTVITGEKHVSNFVLEHKGKPNDFTCSGKIKTSYIKMDDQFKIAFKGTDLIENFDGSLEIKDTLKPVSFKTGFKSARTDNRYVSEANYNDNTIKSEVNMQHPKYKGKVTVKTKVEGYENIELDFDQESTNNGAKNKITIKPFNYKPVTVEADLLFMGVTWFETDLKFKSGFEGFEVVESKISHKGNWSDFASSFTFKKSNMKPIELVASLNAVVLSNIDGSFKFTSGLDGAEEVECSLKHTGDLDEMSSKVIIKIPKNEPVQIDLVFAKDLPSKLEGKLAFVSGIEGAKNLELSVEHKIGGNDYSQKLVIHMPFNKHIKVVQKLKNEESKKEEVFLFTSHFKGMENVQLTMVHNGDPKNFVNTITVYPPFMKSESMQMVSKLDMNDDYTEIKGNLKFISGIEGAEDVHATLTHSGPFNDFKNKLVIRPPFMDEMDLSTSVKFEEKQLLQMNFDFNSKLIGAETLGFSSNNKLIDDNRVTSQSEIKLDKLRKINVDIDGKGKFSKQNSDTEIFVKFDLMTPFEKVRTVNFEYLTDRKSKNVDEAFISKDMVSVTHNGKKYYDTQATTEMINGKSVVYTYNMEAPYQIEYSYNVQFVEPYSADVMVNWNKLEPNSNLKLQGKFENMNDLKVKLIHPTRTVALEGALKDEDEKSAMILVTWDEDSNQAVGIETKWQDQNRRGLDILDGSIKVTTPFRAVEASGSINKVLMRKSAEGTVFWDADKDKTKKISMLTEVTPDDNGYSGRVQLSLPVIGKEYTLTRQLTKNEGNVLCESRTEFSYSSDPRKTIVFTSKLENLSTSKSTNHSYTFGVAQAFTNVDTSFTAHLGSSDKLDSVGMLVKYQTSELQKKNLLLLAEIDKLEKKIIIQTVGPRIAGGIVGHIQGKSPVTVSIRGLHDLKDAIETDITIDSKKKAMEIQMKYNKAHPKNILHIAAKYPSKTNLDAQIYRTGDKPQITDAVVKINLRTSRILHTKINWRPQAFKEMMDFGVQTLEKCGKSANDEFKSTANDVEKELSAKFTAISTELETELKPYVNSLSKSLLIVQNKLNKMKQRLNEMYKDNDLYVKDVTDGVKQKTSAALEFYKKSVIEMKNAVSVFRERINRLKVITDYPFDKKYKQFVNEVSSRIQTCKQEMVDILKKETETLTKKMKESVESMRKDVQEMTDKIRKQILDLLDGVLEKAEVKELIAYVEDVLKNLPDGGNLPEIDWDYYIAKINNAIKQKLSELDLANVYNDVVNSTKTAIVNQLGPIMKDQKVKELQELVDNLQKKLKQAYKHWNIEKTLKSYLIDMYNDLQTYIKEDIAALKFLHWDKNRIIAFDPEQGNIEFEVYLPSPADTLESFPKLNLHKYVKKIDNIIKKVDALDLPKVFDISIWDFYYKYKPSWNPKDWVPPFDTFALVAGNQHFITFDQRQIDFAGRCSYILAKDMVDNKFTVIMNYNGKRRPEMKSLLVLAEGKSIEIFQDFSVKLDNRPTELPIKHERLSVIRDGNLIQVDTGRGLIISGNLANQHIAFVLSGWYFGKVGGLLGSYDNEQYDDMVDRTGQVTKDINAMAQTWEVASRCRNSANIASDVKVEAGQKGYMKCSKLFVDSGSTLRPCFKVVEPQYFMKVCMAEMKTSKGDGCNAVSAYVKQCRQNNVMLWEPKQCISCRAPNKEFYEGGESIKLSPSSDDFQVPKSADVVMVVEQTGCNSNPVKHLGDLVDKIEQAFVKNEITNNRYGLIGFGGTPRSAFGRKSASVAHTFEGSIFSESNNFAKGKETLKFGYHFTDPLEAIMTASNMPFRAGVSKTIVLLHCGECSDSKIVKYNHLRHVLSTRDITLHIIREQDIRLTGNSSPKNVIMGFDKNNKYMMKPLPDMSSNDVRIPEDSCVSLSLMSDGSLFHSSGLTDSKIRNRKWFLNTVSKRISQTARPNKCQVCQCVADHTGMAKSVCRTCYSSVSDYLPNWWSTIRHPNKIQNQFEKQYKEYFGDDTWKVLDQM